MKHVCIGFCTALLIIGVAWAQPNDPAELGAFLDGVMNTQLKAYQIPGAVLVVVQDGEVRFAKGYGYADIEARTPVDPQTTLFRIGSVTKLFTYTAIMQLVENEQLELDTPVSTYLSDLDIPATYQPITLTHLITHTAGLEDVTSGLFAREAEAVRPLGDTLAEQMPMQIRPPGTLAAYSNHGVGLLGLVIERISGLSWNDYVEVYILEPLEMNHTTGHQPVPDALMGDLAMGYRPTGKPVAQPFTFVPLGPVGGMSASGLDMAHFMIAHLQNGQFEGVRILEDTTAEQMHSQHFTHDVRLGGMAHGFYESRINGEYVIGHSGGMPNFITNLWLLPEHDLGLFVSYSSTAGAQAQAALSQAFMNRYFPQEVEASPYKPEPNALSHLAGAYRSTRIVKSGEDKLGNLIQSLFVRADNGRLHLSGLTAPSMTLEPLGPDLFQEIDTGERVVAVEREGVKHLFFENTPYVAYTSLRWFETPQLHGVLLLITILVFFSVIIATPLSAYVHWRSQSRSMALERWARGVPFVMSLILLGFILALTVAMTDFVSFTFGTPFYLTAAGWLVYIAVILVLITILLSFLSWVRGFWNVLARLHYSLVAFAGAAFVWQLLYWNILRSP